MAKKRRRLGDDVFPRDTRYDKVPPIQRAHEVVNAPRDFVMDKVISAAPKIVDEQRKVQPFLMDTLGRGVRDIGAFWGGLPRDYSERPPMPLAAPLSAAMGAATGAFIGRAPTTPIPSPAPQQPLTPDFQEGWVAPPPRSRRRIAPVGPAPMGAPPVGGVAPRFAPPATRNMNEYPGSTLQNTRLDPVDEWARRGRQNPPTNWQEAAAATMPEQRLLGQEYRRRKKQAEEQARRRAQGGY